MGKGLQFVYMAKNYRLKDRWQGRFFLATKDIPKIGESHAISCLLLYVQVF